MQGGLAVLVLHHLAAQKHIEDLMNDAEFCSTLKIYFVPSLLQQTNDSI